MQSMIMDKKYYSIVYILETLLFFQTTLILLGKFTKSLHSTSLSEKHFNC